MHYRRTVTLVTAATLVLLTLLLALGLRHYSLNSHHQEVVRQAEKLTFQFAMIREYVLEVLISGQTGKLATVTPELEELGLQAAKLLQSSQHVHQPIDFTRSFDPSSLILLLKGMTDAAPAAQVQQLNRELRDLGERFLVLDRSLVQQSRQQLVFFQHIVIGALALTVSGLLLMLLFLYRRTFAPLIALAEQCASSRDDDDGAVSPDIPDTTLAVLAESLRRCRQHLNLERQTWQIHQRALEAVRCARTQLGQAGGRDKILQHCCRGLLDNPDACLAWIGLPDPDGHDVIPVSADASSSMTREECASCMTVLLTAAEESGLEFNPAARALHGGKPVLQSDILANTPKGLIKNTPLADGQAVCAAFPLRLGEENLGVLSLYAKNAAAFGPAEMDLFSGLADTLALRLRLWQVEDALNQSRRFLAHCLHTSQELLAIVDSRGTIVEAGDALRRLAAHSVQEFSGRHWSCCLRPTLPGETAGLPLPGTAAALPRETQLLALTSTANDQRWRCRLIPLTDAAGDISHYALWGEPQQTANLEDSAAEQECASMLPILGRITASCAHDIRDVASGIINYAQLGQDSHPQAQEIFGKIFKAGERMADVARALVFYGQQEDAVEEFLPVSVVLTDTVKLLSPLCHSDHIRLDLSQQEELSRLRLPGRPLQQILCILLLRGRRALNSRFPGADSRKRLHMQSRSLWDAGENHVEITVTDWGGPSGLTDPTATDETGGTTRDRVSPRAVERCRLLTQSLGGQLRVAEQNTSTSVVLTLPLQPAATSLPRVQPSDDVP